MFAAVNIYLLLSDTVKLNYFITKLLLVLDDVDKPPRDFPNCYKPLLMSCDAVFLNKLTSWRTSRHVAVFPANVRVSGVTPRSIRGTAIRVTTRVGVILSVSDIFRNPPMTMRTLRGPRLTTTTRPSDIDVATVANPNAIVTIYSNFYD